MSRKCQITNKGPLVGNNRSKALNATKKVWNVNMQKRTFIVNGEKVSIYGSAKAIKTFKKKNNIN